MSDSRLNKTGLQYFYNRLKTVFASKSAFETLEGRVDGIVATGGEPNVIETVKRNGTALTVTNKAVDVEVPILTVKRNGTALTPDSNKAVDVTIPTAVSDLTNDSGFQANVLESVSVNGAAQTITSKGVDITVPTKVSDLTNDSGFQANVLESVKVNGTAQTITSKAVNITVPTAVTDLSDASDYATKNYVDTYGGKIDKIKVNGTEQTITSKAVDITVPTAVSALTNDSGFQTSQQVQTAITNSGYQANVIESIKVNGTTQTITSKAVDITMPTAVSDLTNDSGFQTAAQVQTAIGTAIASAYKYKGSVATLNDLPNSPSTGDVYDVQTTGMNYAWNGTTWDALGQLIDTSTLWTTTNLTAITTAEIDAIVV